MVAFAGRERYSPYRSRMPSTEDASAIWSRLPAKQREDRRSVVPIVMGLSRGPPMADRAGSKIGRSR
jgi:hypothetical protein